MLNLDLINILIISVAVLNTIYGLIVYSRNRSDTTNQAFFFLTMCVSLWGICMFIFRSFNDPTIVTLSSRALYATAALIPIASLYFSSIFPASKIQLSRVQKYIWPSPLIVVLFFTLVPTNGLINAAISNIGHEPTIAFNIVLHGLYITYIVGYFCWVYLILFKKLISYKGSLRLQIIYILIGTLATTSIGVFTNLLLPFWGIFTFNWVGQIGILAMISSITYAILKHHLFNIKIIATEILVLFLCLILFAQIFFAQSLLERGLAVAIFFVATVVGVLLVRSVIREVETREEIQRLAGELEKKNERLTELDRLKSQFLSIATHELRTPLGIVRNFISLMLDGSYGKVPRAVEESGKQVFDRVTDMSHSVDTYLDVSRIEQGKMKYDFAEVDFTELTKKAVNDLVSRTHEKGLTLKLNISAGAETLKANLDAPKINEVIINLIDNSIKYTPKGLIGVTLEKVGKNARLTIQDTGMGMSAKTLSNLFKLFSPGEDSKKINPASTGVGLYISKSHVEAHHGSLKAFSDGVGKGSQFVLELPLLTSKA